MTPERWKIVRHILEEALERTPGERASFLDEACRDDEELRREVSSLIASAEVAGDFIEEPPRQLAATIVVQGDANSTIGHYRLLSLIGKGGMGEVYLAEDERLKRKLAIKLLPAAYTNDRERVRRFEQEARAASALNHPNITTIFEVGESPRGHFIAMEYVEGETLSKLIKNGPPEFDQIIAFSLQIADALDEAHSKGITHRDIKPDNVMTTPRGQIKVLDFGLAKIRQPARMPANEEDETVQTMGTAPGIVVGTLNYLSPEQVRGQEVDHRTDIFSFGIVLYEMATGRQPFAASSMTETMDRILHAQPAAMARFNYALPVEFDWIVRKCLEKDQERRYQSAHELLIDLKNLQRDSQSDRLAPLTSRMPQMNQTPVRRVWLPVALAAVVLTLVIVVVLTWQSAARRPVTPSPTEIKSLAVLPLANLSGAAEQEYFSDGLTEALITDLSRFGALRVISRTSVMRYKNAPKPLPEIARELNVDGVIEGSVRRSGDRVSITAKLIHAPTDTHLWGTSYERDLRDVLALQREVARDVAERIRLRLTPEESSLLAGGRKINPAAHESYLQGRYHWNKRTADDLDKAITFFQEAVRLEPDYASAWVGLADSYNLLTPYRNLPASQSYPKSKEAALRALALDPALGEAHAALGVVRGEYDWDWAAAERDFKRALELSPNYAPARQWYAEFLTRQRRFDEALREAERAAELDPLSLIVNAVVGWVHLYSRQPDRAISQLQKTLALDAGFIPARGYLGMAYLQKDDYARAEEELRQAYEISGRNPRYLAHLGVAHALAGKQNIARRDMTELHRLAAQHRVQPFLVASMHTALGENDRAFEWLERAYQERGVWMLFLNIDPLFDRLRSDARFAGLLARLKLAAI
jgi:serine/threonine-protein kinase